MASVFPDQSGSFPTLNFYQAITKLRHQVGPVMLGGVVAWSPEGSFGGGQTWRADGLIAYTPNQWLTLDLKYGNFLSELKQDRKYWEVGVTAKWKRVAFDVRYTDTDLDRPKCFFTDWCEPSVVGKITYDIPILWFSK